MKIRCHTTAWGAYEEFYKLKAKPSIMPSVERLRDERHSVEFDFFDYCEGKKEKEHALGLCKNFIKTLETCIANDEYLFLLQADTIYGAETLYNIATYGQGTGAYICVPHFRVELEKFSPSIPLSNQQLLDYSWRYPHFSTIHSNVDVKPHQALARLALYECGDKTVMHHYYPTIYFFKPDNGDLKFWREQHTGQGWTKYDTTYLEYACTRKVRVIGSADMAFMAEMEWADSHHSDLCDMTRNIPNVVQGRVYSPNFLNTAYVMNKNLNDMGKL